MHVELSQSKQLAYVSALGVIQTASASLYFIEEFRKYMEWAVNDYNTAGLHSSLQYMTPEEFESAISNEEFRKK